MPRTVEFEGRRVEVPDDATDDEVARILGGGTATATVPEPAAASPAAKGFEAFVLEREKMAPEERRASAPPEVVEQTKRVEADYYRKAVDIATRLHGMNPGEANRQFKVKPADGVYKQDTPIDYPKALRYVEATEKELQAGADGLTRAERVGRALLGPFVRGAEALGLGEEKHKREYQREVADRQRSRESPWATFATEGIPGVVGSLPSMMAAGPAGLAISAAEAAPEGEGLHEAGKAAVLAYLGGKVGKALEAGAAGPAALRVPAAHATGFQAAGTATRAAFGEETDAQTLAEEGVLGALGGLQGLRGKARAEGFGKLREPVGKRRAMQAEQDVESAKITREAYQAQQDIETPRITAEAERMRAGTAAAPRAPERAVAAPGVPTGTEAAPTKPVRGGPEAGFAVLPDVSAPVRAVGRGAQHIKDATRQFPRMTRENVAAAEATTKAAASHVHAKALTPLAERDVVRKHGLDAEEFGAALTESNLRGQKDLNIERSRQAQKDIVTFMSQSREMRKSARAAGITPLEKARRTQAADRLVEKAREARKQAEEWAESAANIPSIIGQGVRSVASEAAYQEYVNRPEVKAADEAHVAFWDRHVDPMWRARQMIGDDAEPVHRGRELKGRISVLPKEVYERQQAEMSGDTPPTSARPGALRNKNVTRSGYSNRLIGAKGGYVTDYREIMASRIHREAFGAAKAEGMKALVEGGDAVIVAPGAKAPTEIRGEPAVLVTDVLPSKAGVKEGGEVVEEGVRPKSSLYVRESLAGELRRGWKMAEPSKFGALGKVLRPLNVASLSGPADNLININRGLFLPLVRKMTGSPAEAALNAALFPVQIVRHLVSTARAVHKSAKDLEAQVEMARGGALRDYQKPTPVLGDASENPVKRAALVPLRLIFNPLQRAGNAIDRAARYQMFESYKSLAKKGMVEDSPTAMRDYVNQMGNYLRAAQGAFTAGMVESGIGPFTTAKTTRWANRVRSLTLDPGVKATTTDNAVRLKIEMLSKMTGALTTLGLINWMTTGKVMGREGVPFGSIDTGQDDDNGRPMTVSFLDMIGLGDVPKTVGASAYITAKRRGLNEKDALESAVRQASGQVLSFFTGPATTATTVALTGKNPYGFPVVPEARPDLSGTARRFAGAFFETTPLAKMLAKGLGLGESLTGVTEAEGGDVGNELRQQVAFFGTRPGLSADSVESMPERVRGAQLNQWIDGLKRRIGNVAPAERSAWLNGQMEGLGGDERRRVLKALRGRMAEK